MRWVRYVRSVRMSISVCITKEDLPIARLSVGPTYGAPEEPYSLDAECAG